MPTSKRPSKATREKISRNLKAYWRAKKQQAAAQPQAPAARPFAMPLAATLEHGELAIPAPAAAAPPPPEDPWVHRSAGMRCRTCMYFVRKVPSPTLGRCRRHAPTMSGFPAVFTTDWCGDHKLNEALPVAADKEEPAA